MARGEIRRRLIVNADDFGRSESINEAVVRAHREGVLTTASLMVNEPACAPAVELAKENARLGVGLHLALLCGRSALPPERISGVVNSRGEFSNNPVTSGMRYYFQRRLRQQLEDEMAAQFDLFHATGLTLDHVNGHLHMHMHPVVFEILCRRAREWRITRMRLTCDPFWLNAALSSGAWLYRISHATVYRLLCLRSVGHLRRLGIRHTGRVFGLLQNARVDARYAEALLRRLPAGDSELYSHPSLDDFNHEFQALISPAVRRLVQEQGIQLIRYQDL